MGGDRRARGALVVGGAGRVDEGGHSAGHGEVSVQLLCSRYGDGGVAGNGRSGGRLAAAQAGGIGRSERAELPAIFDEGVVGPAPGDAADGGAGLRQIGGRRELCEGVSAHDAWRGLDAVPVAGGNLQVPAVVTGEREVVGARGNPVGIDGRDSERRTDFTGRSDDAHGGEVARFDAGGGVAHAGDGGGGNTDGAAAERGGRAAGGPGGGGEERGLGRSRAPVSCERGSHIPTAAGEAVVAAVCGEAGLQRGGRDGACEHRAAVVAKVIELGACDGAARPGDGRGGDR